MFSCLENQVTLKSKFYFWSARLVALYSIFRSNTAVSRSEGVDSHCSHPWFIVRVLVLMPAVGCFMIEDGNKEGPFLDPPKSSMLQ